MSTPEALLTEIRERRPLPFPASTRQVIIHAARAWTPSLDAPQPATLTIDDGTISSIIWGATSHAAPTPAGSLVLTLDDHVTLLPGLVDCHNHSSFANSFDFDTSAFATAASTVANLSTILASGITSIHSAASCKLGVEAALRTLVHEGRISGPRWRSAGPELTPPHGLGAGINVSPWETNCFGYVAPDIHALQAAIRECAEFGVDTIKLNIRLGGHARLRQRAATFILYRASSFAMISSGSRTLACDDACFCKCESLILMRYTTTTCDARTMVSAAARR